MKDESITLRSLQRPQFLPVQRVEQIRSLPRNKQKFVMEMIDTVINQQQS